MTLEIKMRLKRLLTVTMLAVLSMGTQAQNTINSLSDIIDANGDYIIIDDISVLGHLEIHDVVLFIIPRLEINTCENLL